jgi:hypothetical protein|tara:strand:- start:99 stop:272 length:174 start_codon:yes stop_codon:yes gene_type:complete
MTEIAKGRRVLTTSDSLTNIHGLGKEHSAKLISLAKDQRKTPKKYLEDLLDYYYIYL